MENNLWVPVKGYEGSYVVNIDGDVKGIDRVITLKNGKTRAVKERLLWSNVSPEGYFVVTLSKDGVAKKCYLHRILAEAFIPNPEGFKEVNHISGDKLDIRLENLEWTSHRKNVIHAYKNNLNSNKGATHSFAVGVVDNELGQEFDTIKDWAEARGINYNTGRNVLSGCNKSLKIDLTKIFKQTALNSELGIWKS